MGDEIQIPEGTTITLDGDEYVLASGTLILPCADSDDRAGEGSA